MQLSDISAGHGGFVVNGQSRTDFSGWSVANAGDVNGDGYTDLVIGAPKSDVGAYLGAGRIYVVFGGPARHPIELSDVAAGHGGFMISGESTYDNSGLSVAAAGDVNGDGLADLIVGAPYANAPPEAWGGGRSYVVFGRSDTSVLALSDVAAGHGGFVMNAESTKDHAGLSVAGVGDVNGDGLADVVVGAPRAGNTYNSHYGRSYVVFGRSRTTAVDLSAVAAGRGGFVVEGEHDGDYSGHSVAGAGDVNGDGLADVLIGAYHASPGGVGWAGKAYVVFGRTDTAPVALTGVAAGSGGFVINGQCSIDQLGLGVAGAGDVDGDGLDDLLVGAPTAMTAGGYHAGRTYVVFGKTDTLAIDASGIVDGAGGFVINGASALDWSGLAVSGGGDIDGDGLADILVGATGSPYDDPPYAGHTYIIYGKTSHDAIDLTTIAQGSGGFVIDGESARDRSGGSIAGGADVNGDGLADLVVGAIGATPHDIFYAGRTYVIFGSTKGAFGKTDVDRLGGRGDDTLTGTRASETLVGGAGSDLLKGKGGADVFRGGQGDDTFVLDAGNVVALEATYGAAGERRRLARVAGGTGTDTLRLSGEGITLDFGKIAGESGMAPRIDSVERIDLTGSGENKLRIGVSDVQHLAGMNLINRSTQDALGWSNGTYAFPAQVRRHQLVVDGNAGDIADLSRGGDAWVRAGTVVSNAGITYTVYESQRGRAQVIVANAITLIRRAADP